MAQEMKEKKGFGREKDKEIEKELEKEGKEKGRAKRKQERRRKIMGGERNVW